MESTPDCRLSVVSICRLKFDMALGFEKYFIVRDESARGCGKVMLGWGVFESPAQKLPIIKFFHFNVEFFLLQVCNAANV